jgi:hypothetical protein
VRPDKDRPSLCTSLIRRVIRVTSSKSVCYVILAEVSGPPLGV